MCPSSSRVNGARSRPTSGLLSSHPHFGDSCASLHGDQRDVAIVSPVDARGVAGGCSSRCRGEVDLVLIIGSRRFWHVASRTTPTISYGIRTDVTRRPIGDASPKKYRAKLSSRVNDLK